ncbi:MAG: Ig-like domain-containing protein, partial [Erysipelotrichaceae bacterium]|nr:Ig-like domain-containing protein [Erysipelotrichaceae bacterium]
LAEYLAGNTDGSNLNLAKAEMDNDGRLSSHDVYLLLNWLPEEADMTNTVPANGSRKVTVEIKVNDTKLNNYPSGAYIEGFTNIECVTVDGEGKDYGHVHSIPVLGFYGSWTDPSMFDNTSYIDTLYNEGKTPYTGNSDTNYVQLTYNGVSKKFSGNPYIVESEFPAGRLAVNSSTVFNTFKYNLLRAAGTVGFAVSKIDDYNGNVTSVMNSSIISSNTEGIWYYQQQSAWQNTSSKSKTVSVKLSDLALNEGDKFRIGIYAIPEYNAMKVNNDYSSASAGVLGSAKFNSLLLSNVLGKGALVGYDFAVDNTKPVISSATLSGKNITVNASDNMNLAYLAVMSLDGTTKYAEIAPGTSTYSITFDATTAINNAKGYVAVFAGDYAGNEDAVAIQVNSNTSGVDPYTVTSISLTPGSLDLYKGNEADLTVNVSPLTANNREVTWSSSKTSVATVDANGHVVAVGRGTATITATSKANTSIKATCSVNVTSVDKTLNGIVWDEEGGEYFSSFNSSSLPAWNKLHNDNKQMDLQTAFMNSTSDLYAGTLDSNMSTVLYKVNRSTYDLTEFGTNYVAAFDVARSKSGYFAYVFAKYAIIGNLNPETEDGETFSGFPYGLLDFNEKTGSEAYLCGIAIKSYGSNSSVYYLLDEDGKIWQTTLSSRTSLSFGTPSLVIDTGIPTSFMYQSLYYDGSYIFWSHYNGSETELIIIDPSTKKIYHAGDFGEGVWPVAGLYVNGSVAPAAVDDEIDTEEYNPDLTPIMTRDQLITDEVISRFNSEYEKMNSHKNNTESITEQLANEVVGSTESIKGYNFIRKETETTLSNDSNTSIVLSEDEETTNGVYFVEYDNTILNNPVVSFNPANEVKAFRIDESTGTIKIVYAAKNGIEANDEIAEIAFDEPIDSTVVTITTVERSSDLSVNESNEVDIIVEQTAPEFSGHSMVLSGQIGVDFGIKLPD